MKTCKSYERAGKGKLHTTRWEGFDDLLRRNDADARRFAYRLAGNADEAEELVQHAAYRALRYWDTFDPVASFQTWYLTIIKNLFRDERKRLRTISLNAPLGDDDSTLEDALSDGLPRTDELLERQESIALVRGAIAALTAQHRAVITLCDLEGMSYEDAARKLGVRAGTIRSRLFRARAALRRQNTLTELL